MKLNEIFDTTVSNRNLTNIPDAESLEDAKMKRIHDGMSNDLKGVGSFGYVKQGGDPFLINKRSHDFESLKYDAYYVYIKYIVDNKLAESNPFFPRVYDIKTFTVGNKARYSIKLEKLIDLSDLSDEELYHMCKMLFTNFDKTFENLRKEFQKMTKEGLDNRKNLYFSLEDSIKNKLIKNELLLEAINIIENIKIQNKLSWDLHRGNVMVRRGSAGLQLVIIDPLQ